MAANDYHFITHWRVESTPKEITNLMADGPGLARWWPSVYLAVKEIAQGDPDTGLGREVDLFTKGWLPYTLRWQFTVTSVNHPNGFSLEARGDFIGRGIWTFEQDGDFTNIVYDWEVSAGKHLLRNLSWLLKPVFSANHHWAMRKGEESLKLELARMHAKTADERARVPMPPPATFSFGRVER